MMLLLRERALKEKTEMELAWLEQLQQKHRRDKGTDDKHPDLIRRQKNIIRTHRLRKVGGSLDPVVICTCLVLIHLMEVDASNLKLVSYGTLFQKN